MEKTNETTPEVEVNKTETQSEETTSETLEVLHEEKQEKPTVGLDKFLEVKNEAKELRKELQDLQKRIEQGESKKEVSEDISALAKEYNVDETLLERIATAATTRASKEIEARLVPKLHEVERVATEDKREKAFNSLLEKAFDVAPEYEKVINKDVIKMLAYDPRNAKKTLVDIMEETYGAAISGKKSFETKRGSGREPEKLDFDSVRANPGLLEKVLQDDSSRKEYNSELEKRLLA